MVLNCHGGGIVAIVMEFHVPLSVRILVITVPVTLRIGIAVIAKIGRIDTVGVIDEDTVVIKIAPVGIGSILS